MKTKTTKKQGLPRNPGSNSVLERMESDRIKETSGVSTVEKSILLIRGKSVLLDETLAQLYGVETKALTRSVKRNIERFPEDFLFQLTQKEFEALRCQFGTSNKRGGRRYLPQAFTQERAPFFETSDWVLSCEHESK